MSNSWVCVEGIVVLKLSDELSVGCVTGQIECAILVRNRVIANVAVKLDQS